MDEKKIELKPCPFCGGKAEFYLSGIEQHKFPDRIKWIFSIRCSQCRASSSGGLANIVEINLENDGQMRVFADDREKAVEHWNRRSNNEH